MLYYDHIVEILADRIRSQWAAAQANQSEPVGVLVISSAEPICEALCAMLHEATQSLPIDIGDEGEETFLVAPASVQHLGIATADAHSADHDDIPVLVMGIVAQETYRLPTTPQNVVP